MAKTPVVPTPNVNPLNPAAEAVVATPENTPVPGGGRWGWDAANTCWVDKDAPEPIEPIEPAVAPAAEAQPAPTSE